MDKIDVIELLEFIFKGYPEILVYDNVEKKSILGVHIEQPWDGPTETRLLTPEKFIKLAWADDETEWRDSAEILCVTDRYTLFYVSY